MIDANDLETIAKQRPNERFLKGTGVLKLLGAIRQLERENRELRAALESHNKLAMTVIAALPDGEEEPE